MAKEGSVLYTPCPSWLFCPFDQSVGHLHFACGFQMMEKVCCYCPRAFSLWKKGNTNMEWGRQSLLRMCETHALTPTLQKEPLAQFRALWCWNSGGVLNKGPLISSCTGLPELCRQSCMMARWPMGPVGIGDINVNFCFLRFYTCGYVIISVWFYLHTCPHIYHRPSYWKSKESSSIQIQEQGFIGNMACSIAETAKAQRSMDSWVRK